MSQPSIVPLSESVNGRSVLIAATATAGTLVHTSQTGGGSIDRVFIYAANNHTADVVLTIEFGGATSPNDLVIVTIPTKSGLSLVIPGLPLMSGLVVRAFAATTNVISLTGYVSRN